MFDNNLQSKAAHMATLCKLSHQQPLTVRRDAKHMGYDAIKHFDHDHVRGYGFVCQNHIVISFVAKVAKISHNTHCKYTRNISGYFVNEAYEQMIQDIWPDMNFWMQLYPNRKRYFCGHGTAGAIATLAAARMKKFTTVITFASTKAGSRKFANWFNDHHLCYRLNAYHDSIKLNPFLHGHVGFEYIIDKNGEIRYPSFINKISQLSAFFRKKEVDINEYWELLNKKAKN